MIYLLSSPYLRVFGDDRVHGTGSRCCWCRWLRWSLVAERGSTWEILCFFMAFGNSC